MQDRLLCSSVWSLSISRTTSMESEMAGEKKVACPLMNEPWMGSIRPCRELRKNAGLISHAEWKTNVKKCGAAASTWQRGTFAFFMLLINNLAVWNPSTCVCGSHVTQFRCVSLWATHERCPLMLAAPDWVWQFIPNFNLFLGAVESLETEESK